MLNSKTDIIRPIRSGKIQPTNPRNKTNGMKQNSVVRKFVASHN